MRKWRRVCRRPWSRVLLHLQPGLGGGDLRTRGLTFLFRLLSTFVQVDECAEAPCLNEGHCIDLLGDFSCSCPLTWTGRRCEERVERWSS